MESVRTPTGKVLWQGEWRLHSRSQWQAYADHHQMGVDVWLDGQYNGTYLYTIQPNPNKENPNVARLIGYFVDYLVETTDTDFTFEVKRMYFTTYEQKAYHDFRQAHPDRVVRHGERYS